MRLAKFIIAMFFITFSLSVFADVSVQGYTRKDGTYVQPYHRSNPVGNPYNNWSTKGNSNPYTGREGTQNPQQNNGWGNHY